MKDRGPIRVLWATPTIGSHFGGPTTTVVNGLIAEKQGGLEPELITTIGPGESPDDVEAARRLIQADVPVRMFPRTGLISRGEAWGLSPRLALWLMRNLRKYDVLHLQYVWCMTSIIGVICARMARVPVVMTPHESLTDFDIQVASRHPALKLFKRLLRPLFLSSLDQLILMSELEERDTRYGRVPVEIVSHAVLEEPATGRRVERDPASGLKIAFIGRNIEKKGLHLILDAIAMRPDAGRQLTVAGPPGTGEYQRDIEKQIERLGIEDRVEWVGFVDDRSEYLGQADVLAMPSVYEGFGMVSAEAMCVGVPVVVPAMSGVAEIVQDFNAGLIMNSSSSEELDRAFAELEADPVRLRELGENGLRAANDRLTFSAFASRTNRVYEGLVG